MSKSEEYCRKDSSSNSVIEWASSGHGNESTVLAQHRCAPRIVDDYNIRYAEDAEDDAESDLDVAHGKASPGSMELAHVYEGEAVRTSTRKNPPSTRKNPPSSKGGSSKGGSSRRRMVEVVVIAALVGVIAVASLAIGYTVVKHRLESRHPMGGGSTGENDGGESSREQQFLEIAERVIVACGYEALDRDRTGCQTLCRARMCCFEGGEYSCEEDEGRHCAVYAGCEALVGFTAEMNEE